MSGLEKESTITWQRMRMTKRLVWAGTWMSHRPSNVSVSITMVTLGIRLYLLNEQLDFPVRAYISQVLLVSLRVVVPSVAVPLLLKLIWPSQALGAAILRIVVMEAFAFVAIVTIGLTKKERLFIYNAVRKKLR